MMPLPCSVGQHEALQAAHRGMRDGEHLMAFLDDVHMATDPNGVGFAHATVEDSLWEEAGIRLHVGKTKVWIAEGIRLAICDVLERVVQEQNASAGVWRGAGIPVEQQGLKILGSPLGHPASVQRFLNSISEEHQTSLKRIPLVGDVQAAWLLLVHCAGARANKSLRCVDLEAVEPFARGHDQDMLQCLRNSGHTCCSHVVHDDAIYSGKSISGETVLAAKPFTPMGKAPMEIGHCAR